MKFYLDESYMCDVHERQEYSAYKGIDPDNLTPEAMIKILRGEDRITIHSSKDHPEFNRFREQLGDEGYIRIEHSWCNGDRVTKSFTLNDVEFKVGDKFCSACAMKHHLKFLK
jgi:hypothetical protein